MFGPPELVWPSSDRPARDFQKSTPSADSLLWKQLSVCVWSKPYCRDRTLPEIPNDPTLYSLDHSGPDTSLSSSSRVEPSLLPPAICGAKVFSAAAVLRRLSRSPPVLWWSSTSFCATASQLC